MRILFHAPMKPLGHPLPSGDLAIAQGLYDFLTNAGHEVAVASRLRSRWIYWKPYLWPRLFWERRHALRLAAQWRADVWLTYHAYYKAPDLLGPCVAEKLHIPYAVFQGIFSTKRRRSLKTWPGYAVNRRALARAAHVFSNRRLDHENLLRLVRPERLTYVAPGIFPDQFAFDAQKRAELRKKWGVKDEPVILSAAMFRPGVKTQGLAFFIQACGGLSRKGVPFRAVIAGDGRTRDDLVRLADAQIPGKALFLGRVDRPDMAGVYSASDIFAFPGIRESLGMVFLEAQSCSLPVAAFDNGGIPEVVRHKETGLLTPFMDMDAYVAALQGLAADTGTRQAMGRAAAASVRREHDLFQNYRVVEKTLARLR